MQTVAPHVSCELLKNRLRGREYHFSVTAMGTVVRHVLAAVTGLLYSLGVAVAFLWLNGPREMVQVLFTLTLALGFYCIFWRSPPPRYQKSVAVGFGAAIAGFVFFAFPWLFFAR